MIRFCLISWGLLVFLIAAPAELPATQPEVQVRLKPLRREFLLGEPVVLDVVVTNVGEEAISNEVVLTDEHSSNQEIDVYFTRHGEEFRRCGTGSYQSGPSFRNALALPPGESRDYRVRVLYLYPTKQLAFDKPGRVVLRVHYPLVVPDLQNPEKEAARSQLESNNVGVEIKEPAGLDAELWQTIQRPEYSYFLQRGESPTGHEKIALEAAELLRAHPRSGYAAALQYALARYYEHTLQYRDAPEEKRAIATVLGLRQEQFFPDDKRLDAKVGIHFAQATPFEVYIKALSEQAGVPLDADPDFLARKSMGGVKESLRSAMRTQASVFNGVWERRGDGYYLRPKTELLPQDQVLNQMLLVYFPEPVPLAEVLRNMTRRTYIRIEADPALGPRMVRIAELSSRRTVLERLAEQTGGAWVRVGNYHYRLEAAGAAPPEPAPSKTPPDQPANKP